MRGSDVVSGGRQVGYGAPAQRLLAVHDRQYSVLAVTDGDGAVVEQRTFSPYGADPTDPRQGLASVADADGHRVHPADLATDILYTGRHYDPTIGENNHRRRYLPLNRGRWDQADPLGTTPGLSPAPVDPQAQYGDGASLYQYIRSLSMNGADPSGLIDLYDSHTGVWVNDPTPSWALHHFYFGRGSNVHVTGSSFLAWMKGDVMADQRLGWSDRVRSLAKQKGEDIGLGVIEERTVVAHEPVGGVTTFGNWRFLVYGTVYHDLDASCSLLKKCEGSCMALHVDCDLI